MFPNMENMHDSIMRFIKTKLIHLLIIGGFVACMFYYWPGATHRNGFKGLAVSTFLDKNVRTDKKIDIHFEDIGRVPPHTNLSLSRFNIHDVTLDFLKQFKNPCFIEENIPPSKAPRYKGYKNNAYFKRPGFPEIFETIQHTVIKTGSGVCSSSKKCRMRCLPYFMIFGANELVTSSLYADIANHVTVQRPLISETEFWSKYRFQGACLNDYMDLYDNVTSYIYEETVSDATKGGNLVTGEYNSIYSLTDPFWREDPRNQRGDTAKPTQFLASDLHGLLPNLKFILLLSEPVAHIYWHYNNAPFGRAHKSPEEFHERVIKSLQWFHNCTQSKQITERQCISGNTPYMDAFEDRGDKPWWPKSRYAGAMRDGIYDAYIKDLMAVYPRRNILVLRADEYVTNYSSTLKTISDFLGIESDQIKTHSSIQQRFKSSNEFKPMFTETEELLKDFFRPFNERLAKLLGDEKYMWNY